MRFLIILTWDVPKTTQHGAHQLKSCSYDKNIMQLMVANTFLFLLYKKDFKICVYLHNMKEFVQCNR